MTSSDVPTPGHWPVDPQEDVQISKDRIWVDGCFDFAHHGHAGALLQAKRLGKELLVGIHSDEDILKNKGPTVMRLKERSLMHVDGPPNQYPTPHMSPLYHSNGEDCYRYVKAAGRFLVVKRTPSISTTDLVGRMLLCTKNHFIKSLDRTLSGNEGSGSLEERKITGEEMRQRIKDYATDETGLEQGPSVFTWSDSEAMASHQSLVEGRMPQLGQRIIYVDGGFDLFSSGHIEFLRQVVEAEKRATQEVLPSESSGTASLPAFIIVGVHNDNVVNRWKGINYPIMNIFERGLCVLQCRYVNCLIFEAPFTPTQFYLDSLPYGRPNAVYHGPTSYMPVAYDPYLAAKALNIYREIGPHEFQHINATEIVQRILRSRKMYEARQQAKEEKTITEDAAGKRQGNGA